MNWKIKAHIMAILSRVPFGRRAFSWLQRAGRTNRLDPQEGLSRALEIVQMARDAGVAIEGAHCVEVGTGWRPYVPFLLQLIGASRTTSIDVNPWLTKKFAKETLQALSERIPEISTRTATNAKTIQARIESAQTASLHSLHRMLDALGVDYHCPGDARSTGLRAGSVDIVCSSNVLEHVPTQVLEAIHCEF